MFALRRAIHLSARLVCTQNSLFLRHVPASNQGTINLACPKTFIHTNANPEEQQDESEKRNVLGKLEGKLKLMFTCKRCMTRNSKVISKLAYEKGVIIVRCDGCKNNHLIADNLGWFSENNSKRNIERIMMEKGETVRRILNDMDGYYEAVAKAEIENILQQSKNNNESAEKEEESAEPPAKV